MTSAIEIFATYLVIIYPMLPTALEIYSPIVPETAKDKLFFTNELKFLKS